MDIFQALGVAARRWYVLIPLLLITVAGSVYTYSVAKVQFVSSASIGFAGPSVVPSTTAGSSAGGVSRTNALLSQGGTVLLANLESIALSEPTVVSQIRAQGGTAAYTTSVLTRTASIQLPLMTITSTSGAAATSQRTTQLVLAQADATLATVQADAGVPQDLAAKTYTVQEPGRPYAQSPGRVRATATVAVVGLAISVLLAVLVDAVVRRRRRRPARDTAPDTDAPDTDAPDTATATGAAPDTDAPAPTTSAAYDGDRPEPTPLSPTASAQAAHRRDGSVTT